MLQIGDQNVVKSQGSETSLQQVKVQSSKEEDVHVTSDDNKRTKSKDKSKLSPSVATSDPNTETDASRSDKVQFLFCNHGFLELRKYLPAND